MTRSIYFVELKMWQRVLGNRQINSIITSKISKTSAKALFSTNKTDVASRSQNKQQNSYTAFAESLNKHKITINTQHSDVDSQYVLTNSSNNNNKYNYRESANLLEDLNNRYIDTYIRYSLYTVLRSNLQNKFNWHVKSTWRPRW